MAKLFSLLCLVLVVCHSTYASGLWSLSYGERTATPIQSFADSESGQVGAGNLPGEQYYDNVELHQSQPQVNANGELLSQQVLNPGAEHKVGTKGGFLGFFSRQKQTPTSPILISVDGPTQPFANNGYIETVSSPVLVTNATGNNKEQKSRFRSYLPWNWVFVNPSSQTVENAPQQQTPPIVVAPKRSWSIFPQRPTYSKRQFSQCYCWGPQPEVGAFVPLLTDQVQTPYLHSGYGGSASNVQPVPPTNDYQGLESKPLTTYVQAPPVNSKVANAQPSLPVQTADQSVQSESTLGSTGAVEQTNTQQVAPQQVPYTFANNANSASLSTSTNFQSSAGEPVQSTQMHSTN